VEVEKCFLREIHLHPALQAIALDGKWLPLTLLFCVNHRKRGVQPSDCTIFSPILLLIVKCQ